MQNLLILSLPLDKKKIKELDQAGVYFFIKAPSLTTTDISNIKEEAVLENSSIIYIGKAKEVRKRLLNYKIFIRQRNCQPNFLDNDFINKNLFIYEKKLPILSHEEFKKNRLGTVCQMLVIKTFSSHFEACLEEINYIKKYSPIFNKKLKSYPKLCYLHLDQNFIQLVQRKLLNSSLKPLSKNFYLCNTKNLRLYFSSLISLIKVLKNKTKISLYKLESFGLKDKYSYNLEEPFLINISNERSYFLQEEVNLLLNGKKNMLIQHIYYDMLEASKLENYKEAATLRDLYRNLKSLQKSIYKGKKLWKIYRQGSLYIQNKFDKSDKIFTFDYADPKKFIKNYEKILLVYLWVKKNWEGCRWERGFIKKN